MKTNFLQNMMLPLVASTFFATEAFAQTINVKGVVKDEAGIPVVGANVLVKGTTNGTITDLDGNFQLEAREGDVIEISYIGYTAQELPASATMNITLREDSELLGEVVVIGYGQVKKEDATGSVTALKPDKISKGVTTSPQDMITGKIAGVNVVSTGGTPGAGATIRIRGGSSLNASNDPLIVIDGLAMDNDGIKGMSNALSLVNPNDIETFTVLKDASATAIYGSRASNGVIIITTKKGNAGAAPKVSYDGNVSFGKLFKKYDIMTGDEYRDYVNQLFNGSLPYTLGTTNTDWQDEVYHTAVSHDHNIAITGGLKRMPYRVSLSYTNQNGIIRTSNFERFTASVNLAPAFFDNYLKFNINAKSMVAWNRYADGAVVGSAISMDPTRPVQDGTKEFGGYYQWSVPAGFNDPDWMLTKNSLAPQNPVALLDQKDDRAKSKSFIGNIEVDYKFHFLPDLRIHANLGGDYSEGRQTTIISPYSYPNNYYGWNGTAYEYKYNLSGSAYLQYFKEFAEGNHVLDVMVGTEEQHFHRTGYELGKGTVPTTGESYDEKTRKSTEYGYHSTLLSYFGRINYTLYNRYLLTATLRQDGTSRFSSDNGNRWGTFPSFALGWKMKEEAFLQEADFLSDLKLRLGWGITGQQNLGNTQDFPYMPLYTSNKNFAYYPIGDQFLATSRPNAYNPNLKWEETTTWNAGFDFGFLNGRISGTLDYYYRETNDLINTVKIPLGTNFSNMLVSNIGSLRNQGIEFSIDTKPIVTNDFTWDLGYNVTWNSNKITKLTGGDDPDYYVATGGISAGTGATIQAHKVGYPASSFYVYEQVYDENGQPIENEFVDRNGDGILNDNDRYIYKKPTADVLMGLSSKMTYKNWDFSFALRASFGNYVYNDVLADRSNSSQTGIWSTSGFYSNLPKQSIALGFSGVGNYFMSDYFIQKASFLRCDNITLGYSFQELFKTNGYRGINGRVYATVQNPFVITPYEGLDPEVQSSADTPGIDNSFYPRPITFLIGLSLQF